MVSRCGVLAGRRFFLASRRRGGIGRHARLRIWYLTVSGFESRRWHGGARAHRRSPEGAGRLPPPPGAVAGPPRVSPGPPFNGPSPWPHLNPGVSAPRMPLTALDPLALPSRPGNLRRRELGAVDGTDPLGSTPELHVPPHVQHPDVSGIPRAHPRPAVPR